jgi:hypothetical protein
MGHVEIALRVAAALWLIGCTLIASYRIGSAVVGPRGLALRWTAVAMAGMWLATVGFHLLLALGWFTLPAALAAVTLLGLGALVVAPRRAPLSRAVAGDARRLRALGAAHRRSPNRAATFFFLAMGVPIVLRTLIVPPLGWDTLTYHGVRAALWVQSGRYTFDPAPGPWTVYRHFFAGSEVLAAWAILPLHGDLFAGLVSAVQWLGVGLAGYAAARELGLRDPYASTAAGVGLFIPTLQLLVGSGYVEPALYAALLGSVALALRFLRQPRGAVACLALAAGGLAVGIKLTAALPALAIGALVALWGLLARRPGAPRLPMWIGLGGFAALAPVLPWVWHCYRETGYLVTMPVQVLGVRLGESDPALAWFLERPGLAPYTWEAEESALEAVFAPPGTATEALGLFSLLPLALFPLGLAIRARRHPLQALLLLGAFLAMLAFYYLPAVSVPRLLWSTNASRFLIGVVLLALPVSFLWCPAWPRAGQLYRRLVLLCSGFYAWFFAHFLWSAAELQDAPVVLLALVAAGLLAWRLARRSRALALAFAVGFLIAGGVLLEAHRIATRYVTARESNQLHWQPKYWVDAAQLLDDPAQPHVIALTSGPEQNYDHWFSLYFLGRELQNRLTYLPVSRDGSILPFGSTGELERQADRESWLRRLRRRRVTEVMTFRPLSVEKGWMDGMPERFQKLTGGDDWGLYRILR